MGLLFYLLFILLIFSVFYHIIYLNNLTHDNLFWIILNFILLTILPLYYFYFNDLVYSLIISIILSISAFLFNLKIKEIFHEVKIFPFLYFLTSGLTMILIFSAYF